MNVAIGFGRHDPYRYHAKLHLVMNPRSDLELEARRQEPENI